MYYGGHNFKDSKEAELKVDGVELPVVKVGVDTISKHRFTAKETLDQVSLTAMSSPFLPYLVSDSG